MLKPIPLPWTLCPTSPLPFLLQCGFTRGFQVSDRPANPALTGGSTTKSFSPVLPALRHDVFPFFLVFLSCCYSSKPSPPVASILQQPRLALAAHSVARSRRQRPWCKWKCSPAITAAPGEPPQLLPAASKCSPLCREVTQSPLYPFTLTLHDRLVVTHQVSDGRSFPRGGRAPPDAPQITLPRTAQQMYHPNRSL